MNEIEKMMPEEMLLLIGARAKALRLLAGWKRSTFAERAGITEASLRRFEQTGQASVILVLRVAMALGRLDEFSGLLQPPPARTIDELEKSLTVPMRKRGTK